MPFQRVDRRLVPSGYWQAVLRYMAAMLLLWLGRFTGLAHADVALRVEFNGPQTRWQLLPTGEPVRVLAHECVGGGARDDHGCERIVLAAMAGRSTLIACPTERFPVLDELRARLWVKSSRPGLQLAARVAFPRSIDPSTGLPKTAIIRGAHTRQSGDWRQIELSGAKKLMGEQVRVLRATTGATIDEREAYVDAIVLAVPGDPQGTEIFTDLLEVVTLASIGHGSLARAWQRCAPIRQRSRARARDEPID
jgi:hypothetical protein